MKKLLLLVALLALPTAAQESYSLPATAPQVAAVDGARIAQNVAYCEHAGLPANCTQAQLDATGRGGVIYPDSLAGRQAFLRAIVVEQIRGLPATREAQRKVRWAGLTQAQRDAYCASLGESAGCDPFAQ